MRIPRWLRPWHVYVLSTIFFVLLLGFWLWVATSHDPAAIQNNTTLRPAHLPALSR